MTNNELYSLVYKFRKAIEISVKNGILEDDIFSKFPYGCCGDTCDLLAQFLIDNNIKTYYIRGKHRIPPNSALSKYGYTQSHAWLITENETIIDITGDQFKHNDQFFNYNLPIYIGPPDDFHNLFFVNKADIDMYNGLDDIEGYCGARLKSLYAIIIKNI